MRNWRHLCSLLLIQSGNEKSVKGSDQRERPKAIGPRPKRRGKRMEEETDRGGFQILR